MLKKIFIVIEENNWNGNSNAEVEAYSNLKDAQKEFERRIKNVENDLKNEENLIKEKSPTVYSIYIDGSYDCSCTTISIVSRMIDLED
jgi:hypothetical protein